MHPRLEQFVLTIRRVIAERWPRRRAAPVHPVDGFDPDDARPPLRWQRPAAIAALIAGAAGALAYLVRHPPLQVIGSDELGLRTQRFTGETSRWRDGSVLVLPGVHRLQRVTLRDHTWHAQALARADGAAPAQTVEGLSVGLALAVRWAVDPARVGTRGAAPPDDGLTSEVIEPAVHGVVYPLLARHTVRELFSTRREEIRVQIEATLRERLAAEGLIVRAVQIGSIDLPADYRRGLDALLAEGLATEKMRYTLELKDKRVRETELDAAADKVRREAAAEAAARERVIAARSQEEAMAHVLPFKERQVEQRRLEAEAERQARIRTAEGAAQARRIEADGEAEARRRLADAEAYRIAELGKVHAAQMAVEGALITRHPLLIHKTLADRLSDKIQVIVAPPSSAGFIGSALVGSLQTAASQRTED